MKAARAALCTVVLGGAALLVGACAGAGHTDIATGGIGDEVAAATAEGVPMSMAHDDGPAGAGGPLYVVRAGGFSATGGGPEVHVVLTDVDASVLWHRDQPAGDAVEMRMSEFVGGWEEAGFADDPPDAIIGSARGGAGRVSRSTDPGVVVEMSDPVWDQVSTTLRFTARAVAGQDPLPETLHDVSLFVEDPAAGNRPKD